MGGALLALLIAFQDKLIYVPRAPGLPREYEFDPTKLGMSFEDVWLTAADGTKIHCWYVPFQHGPAGSAGPPPTGKVPTVLWLQENAGNMAYRLMFVKPLMRYCKCNVLMVMYRGYGASEGSPSEWGLRMDADAALEYLIGRDEDVDPKNIAVFGRSLGGAVAIDLVSRHQDKGKRPIAFAAASDTAGRRQSTARLPIRNLPLSRCCSLSL